MKLHSIDRSSPNSNSFSVRKNSGSHFLKVWHHHVELELVYIVKSSGTRFIGDNIEKFEKGDLILIGKNLPHMWLNDSKYFERNSKLKAEAISLHFREDFLGEKFFNTPEIEHISELFKRAQHGIYFKNVDKSIIKYLQEITQKKGFEKLNLLLQILDYIGNHKDYKLLTSHFYHKPIQNKDTNNLSEIYEYIFKNFQTKIALQDVASIAKMNPSAFSRYFKKVNQKTLSRYINEIRIGYACRKLIKNESNITVICFECGYNSISNFNKQFKSITNLSPSEYILNNKNIA